MRASQTKALAALFLGTLAIFAVVCLVDFQDGSLVREGAEAHARVKGIVDSDRTGNVLKAIRNLKAYSMAARELLDNLEDFKDPKLRNGVVDFVAAFGVESEQDMVTDFAKTIGTLLARPINNHGMALYLLDEINSRTLKGDEIVIKATGEMGEELKGKVLLDSDKLGFEFPPEYIETLAVRGTVYADKQVALHQGTGGKMFELWEKTGKANAYEDMLARIEAKYSAQQHEEDVLEYKGAKLAVKASFHSAMTNEEIETALHPLPTAGQEGAAEVRKHRGFKMPTQEEMEAEAMEEAKKYMASLAADEKTPEALIAEMEAQLEGVTVEVGTYSKVFADSIQQPTIAIVGKKGTIKGQLTALPAPGKTIKHNFPRPIAEHIGHILRVELSADANGSPWLISSFKLQDGYGNAWVEYQPQGSERLSKNGYWLGEEKDNPYWGRPHQKSWLLAKSGQVEPVFRKSLVAGPPSCKDLECFHGTKAEFEAKCKANPKCDGFTLPKETGKGEKFNSFRNSDTFAGCLKAVCHVDGSGTGGDMDPAGAETNVDYYQRVGFTMIQEKAEKANEKKLKGDLLAAKESALSSEKAAKADEKAEKKIAIINVGEHEANAKKYAADEATSKSEYAAAMKERQQKWLQPYWDVDTKQGSCTEAPCAVHADQHCKAGGDMVDTKKGCQRPGTTQTGCEFQCQRAGEPTTEFEHVDKPMEEKTFVKWVSSDIPMCPQLPCDTAPVVVSTSVTCHQVIDGAIVTDSMCIDDGKAKPAVVTKTCEYQKCPDPSICVQSAPISARQSYPSVDLSQPSFTVSLWLNLASDSNDLGIFSYGRYSTCGFMCQTRTGSQGHSIHDIHCRVSNGNGGLAQSNSARSAVSGTPGTWEHITVVKDHAAGTISFYVNGVAKGTNSYSISSESCSDAFYLGGWPGDASSKYLDGQIGGVVVSYSAMTASEVEELYSSTQSTHVCPAHLAYSPDLSPSFDGFFLNGVWKGCYGALKTYQTKSPSTNYGENRMIIMSFDGLPPASMIASATLKLKKTWDGSSHSWSGCPSSNNYEFKQVITSGLDDTCDGATNSARAYNFGSTKIRKTISASLGAKSVDLTSFVQSLAGTSSSISFSIAGAFRGCLSAFTAQEADAEAGRPTLVLTFNEEASEAPEETDANTLQHGDMIHLQNQYDPHGTGGTYLDTCGGATCTTSTKYQVSTSSLKDRDGVGTGKWMVERVDGDGPVQIGDIVHLKNMYHTGSYLDTCGHATCTTSTMYQVSTSSLKDRDGVGTGKWQIEKASA